MGGAHVKWGAWYPGASWRIDYPLPSAVAPPRNALLGRSGRWVARRTLEVSPQTNPSPVVLKAAPTCPWALHNASWGPRVLSFLSDTAILTVHLEVSWRVPRGPSL